MSSEWRYVKIDSDSRNASQHNQDDPTGGVEPDTLHVFSPQNVMVKPPSTVSTWPVI
jgi:hypothetical protein